MSLTENLSELIAACFTGIWIETHEQEDALTEIAQLCREQQWMLATWDLDRGLRLPTTDSDAPPIQDPLSAVRSLGAMSSGDQTTVLVMSNLHRFLQSAEIVQALQHQVLSGKQSRTFIIGVGPGVSLPPELEKLFIVVEHELPSRSQFEEIAQGIATEDGELPESSEFQRVLDASAGLTRLEAEAAYSLSLVRQGRITSDSVWELKTQTLKKSGLLSLYRGVTTLAHWEAWIRSSHSAVVH